MTPAIHSCDWSVLVGIQDPTLLASFQESSKPTLLIQPNQVLADRMLQAWDNTMLPGIRLCRDIVGAEEHPVEWYQYNDPRLDGMQTIEELGTRYPNLCIRGQEIREQRTLERVIHDWWLEDGEPPGQGALVVDNSNPSKILEGCLSILKRFRFLSFIDEASINRKQSLSLPIFKLLQEECFALLSLPPGEPLVWEFNENLNNQKKLREMRIEDELHQNQNKELVQINAEVKSDLEKLTNDHSELEKQYETITEEMSKASARIIELQQSLEQSSFTLDSLQSDQAKLIDKYSQLEQENISLQEVNQVLSNQVNELTSGNTQLQKAYEVSIENIKSLEKTNHDLKIDNDQLKQRQLELNRLTNESGEQLALIMDLFVEINSKKINH